MSIRILDHGIAYWPDVLARLDVDGALHRLWVRQQDDTLHGIMRMHPGSEREITWTWDEVAQILQMEGEPVRMWVEDEADYVHIVTRWVHDTEPPPSTFQRVAIGGQAVARPVEAEWP